MRQKSGTRHTASENVVSLVSILRSSDVRDASVVKSPGRERSRPFARSDCLPCLFWDAQLRQLPRYHELFIKPVGNTEEAGRHYGD